jgi:hypothetical protein
MMSAANSAMTVTAAGEVRKYDAVIKPRRLTDAFDETKGWVVDTTDDCQALTLKSKDTVYVSPIGHFNAGKTFIMSKLSGEVFPHGLRTHTEGLSVAVTPFAATQRIAWMDTAGLNSPAAHSCGPDDGGSSPQDADTDDDTDDPEMTPEEGQAMLQTVREGLANLKQVEDLQRQVAFEFADVFLFVANQVSLADQQEIVGLIHMIRCARAANKAI